MQYYKRTTLDKVLDSLLIALGLANVITFMYFVFIGSWSAFAPYIGAAFLACIGHWSYTSHYPRMDETQKEINEIRAQIKAMEG